MRSSPLVARLAALLALAIVPALAHADDSLLLTRVHGERCEQKLLRKLDTWEPNRTWRPGVSRFDGAETFATPTRKVGMWLEVDAFPGGKLVAYRITPKSTMRTTFEGPNCQPKDKKQDQLLDQNRLRKAFSDDDFQKLIDHKDNGVIVVWSPHMPYSVIGVNNVKAAADHLGIKFIALLDPSAQGGFAEKIRQRENWPPQYMKRMESIELIFRGVTNHYPSILVFSKGAISPKVMPGLTETPSYEAFIRSQLQP